MATALRTGTAQLGGQQTDLTETNNNKKKKKRKNIKHIKTCKPIVSNLHKIIKFS